LVGWLVMGAILARRPSDPNYHGVRKKCVIDSIARRTTCCEDITECRHQISFVDGEFIS